MSKDQSAPGNRTITLDDVARDRLRARLVADTKLDTGLVDVTALGDCFNIASNFAPASVDMLFLDPPYNLNKRFGKRSFAKIPVEQYTEFLGCILDTLLPTVKPDGTVYICGDWLSSFSIFAAASERLNVRNRITWEREKGRGARTNWKNSSEDIWFCTIGDHYTFNVDDVKIRRRVLAPYRNSDGTPKDWQERDRGNYRDTYPSNLWTDITIPFWSMPENTDHPTQKSEKLLAKLILASTNPGDLILDPFLGSGTTSVVAKKLGRHFIGVEMEEEYALLAEKRLELASFDTCVQGYSNGVFWERNSFNVMKSGTKQVEKPKDKSRPLI
ncbi:MAG: site-specific DNA-methyltransferase [Hyphomonadaceae bacterium]|nr:site-specific DNA-methyltransferase [Hyphomonadaceae bacterium]